MSVEMMLFGAVGLVLGLGIGFLIGRSAVSKVAEHSAEVEAELWKTKQENEEYHHKVNHHFEKTAELVGELTDSYKDMTQRYKRVYEHLAQGAQSLASVDTSKMITASTIDQLIYEANEDTHVAEKSSKIPAKTITERPKPNAPDTTETKATPTSGRRAAGKVNPEKAGEKKPEKNRAGKRDEKPGKKTSTAEVKPGKPAEKPEPIDLTSAGEKKETAPEQKEAGKKH